MNAPPPRIQRNRERKARRFVDHFIGQMRAAGVANPEADKPALEKALAQVREASREQWVQAAQAIEDNPPSAETVVLIIAELERKVEHVEYRKKQEAEDVDVIEELLKQRSDPEILDAVSFGGKRRR